MYYALTNTADQSVIRYQDFGDETPPVLAPEKGLQWVQQDPPPPPEPDPAVIEANRVQQLWQAATNYEQRYISNMAIGVLTIGVLQQKPISLAISAWSQGLWADYYARKASGSNNLDFSNNGDMPYSVSELTAEVLG